jgi:hypothetical protein
LLNRKAEVHEPFLFSKKPERAMRIRRNGKIVGEMGITRMGSPKKETPHPIESPGEKEASKKPRLGLSRFEIPEDRIAISLTIQE